MAQQVEHFLGKEEVTSSNLVSSSSKIKYTEYIKTSRIYSEVECKRGGLKELISEEK